MILGTTTIHLGDRPAFMDRLDLALDAEHAILTEVDRQFVGTHQVTTWEVQLADGVIYLEEDTFLGKSLTGPKNLVERVARAAFGVGWSD